MDAVLLSALQRAADAFLGLDPDARQKLGAFRGKVFCMEITAPAMKVFLLPGEDGIAIRHEHDGEPDVTLRGSASAFARLAHASRAGDAAATSGIFGEGKIHIHGDAELAQSFQKILGEFDLDFEELLARGIGDTPARKTALAARDLKNWAKKSLAFSRENAADYLTEEKQAAVSARAAARLAEAVEDARADVDRLEARVRRIRRELERRRGAHNAGE
ncbi:MAG: SCP2 sterol-binding domain-containing protein [Gammaproteobacteria bacterium]|nr:SCP2 sterol-binding domain-containing protein [Gammaproteobacteria bacterium]